MQRQLTRKDVVRLNEIDEGIIAFIGYQRKTMLWGDRKLSPHEVEVFFGMLNEEHKKIIGQIKKMVDEFGSDTPFGNMPVEKEKDKSVVTSSSQSSSDFENQI